VTFPVLSTQRLRLRPIERGDLDNLHLVRQYPEVVRYITGKPASIEDSWNRTLRSIGHWHALGFGAWIVEDRVTGDFLGEAGLFDGRRDITPSLDGTIEAGWTLLPNAQNKGYAFEAMTKALLWGEKMLKPQAFSCIISPDNLASLKLAAKLDFTETARTTYLGDDTVVLRKVCG
jgi:RimJ/RimL family protein N-acetyltransferase